MIRLLFSIFMLDKLYISFLNRLLPRFGKKTSKLAFYYICILEIGLYKVIILFFFAFAIQMKINVLKPPKLIVLLAIMSGIICFKNWLRYNGKRRNILRAKNKTLHYNTFTLISLPLIFILLIAILLQVML